MQRKSIFLVTDKSVAAPHRGLPIGLDVLPSVEILEGEVAVTLDKRAHNHLVASGLVDEPNPLPLAIENFSTRITQDTGIGYF
jgi:hypothetical protein